MKKIVVYILIFLIAVILLALGLIGLKKEIEKKEIEYRCWNMPLNDFYKDKECRKLMEEDYGKEN